VNSRAKGRRGENEVAELFGGTRISRTGEEGPDVKIGDEYFEVKRVAKLPAPLKTWVAQMVRECAHGVLVREDRGPWLLVQFAEDALPRDWGVVIDASVPPEPQKGPSHAFQRILGAP
jgi:hypothetical protein